MLDNDLLMTFRAKAEGIGYQTLINRILTGRGSSPRTGNYLSLGLLLLMLFPYAVTKIRS